ncbi:MAG: CatA-like O-acetyltransferase [Huintestinicola sp.]
MEFTPIEMTGWKRVQVFTYFSQMAPTGYSLTVSLDITNMRKALKAVGMKFYPAYLWLVTKTLNRQTEFKIAQKDGQTGYYDVLTPFYAIFHEDDKTFSMMWTEYSDSFAEFYRRYIDDQKKYGNNHGFLSKSEPPPPNAYTISCMPWVSFTHFAVHSYDNKNYFFPSVEAGKFEEKDGHIMLPLSITCHHAVTDGYHVKTFLNDLQDGMNSFEQYCPKPSEPLN